MQPHLYVGLDLGTSGCRAIAMNAQREICGQAAVPLAAPLRDGAKVEQEPAVWWTGVQQVLRELLQQIDARRIRALAVDGTSGTVLLADAHGNPIGPALMYNDARAIDEARQLSQSAPRNSAAHGTTSGLAKLLWLQRHVDTHAVQHAMHHADWMVGRLCGRFNITDENSALKTGYDAQAKRWPAWLHDVGLRTDWLPQVVTPGTRIDTIVLRAALELELPPDVHIIAGTSDSTAAIIATGAQEPGDAVTSLGSTLVVKVVSDTPLFAPEYGVYSQPLGERWLVGAGSNSGGAVLRHFFNDAQMLALTNALNFDTPTGLDYYPLLAPGERFPLCDPAWAPRLTPRPTSDALFFQGLLEGIAHIEQRAYLLLAQLGAPHPTAIRSVGGGARNRAWTTYRGQLLGVPMLAPQYQDAAYGAALLALQGSAP